MTQYFKNIYQGLYTVLAGMKITFGHLFVKNVTIQYPNVHPTKEAGTDKMPDIARNRLMLDPELCNGCKSCDRICPVKCITVETVKVLPDDPDEPKMKDGSKRKLWVTKFEIDFAKCCFCGLCTTVCPTNSIFTTTEFEYSTDNRNDLIYKFQDLTDEQVALKKKMAADAAAKAKADGPLRLLDQKEQKS